MISPFLSVLHGHTEIVSDTPGHKPALPEINLAFSTAYTEAHPKFFADYTTPQIQSKPVLPERRNRLGLYSLKFDEMQAQNSGKADVFPVFTKLDLPRC